MPHLERLTGQRTQMVTSLERRRRWQRHGSKDVFEFRILELTLLFHLCELCAAHLGGFL